MSTLSLTHCDISVMFFVSCLWCSILHGLTYLHQCSIMSCAHLVLRACCSVRRYLWWQTCFDVLVMMRGIVFHCSLSTCYWLTAEFIPMLTFCACEHRVIIIWDVFVGCVSSANALDFWFHYSALSHCLSAVIYLGICLGMHKSMRERNRKNSCINSKLYQNGKYFTDAACIGDASMHFYLFIMLRDGPCTVFYLLSTLVYMRRRIQPLKVLLQQCLFSPLAHLGRPGKWP